MGLVAAVVAAVLIVLTPLANGSPIDPSSPGFWDNGDFDNVILFLTSSLYLADTADEPPIRALEAVSESVLEHPAGAVTQRAHAPGTPRSPPAH